MFVPPQKMNFIQHPVVVVAEAAAVVAETMMTMELDADPAAADATKNSFTLYIKRAVLESSSTAPLYMIFITYLTITL